MKPQTIIGAEKKMKLAVTKGRESDVYWERVGIFAFSTISRVDGDLRPHAGCDKKPLCSQDRDVNTLAAAVVRDFGRCEPLRRRTHGPRHG